MMAAVFFSGSVAQTVGPLLQQSLKTTECAAMRKLGKSHFAVATQKLATSLGRRRDANTTTVIVFDKGAR
jgi:hypothetical protein